MLVETPTVPATNILGKPRRQEMSLVAPHKAISRSANAYFSFWLSRRRTQNRKTQQNPKKKIWGWYECISGSSMKRNMIGRMIERWVVTCSLKGFQCATVRGIPSSFDGLSTRENTRMQLDTLGIFERWSSLWAGRPSTAEQSIISFHLMLYYTQIQIAISSGSTNLCLMARCITISISTTET